MTETTTNQTTTYEIAKKTPLSASKLALIDTLSGISSGVLSKIAEHPFDTVKVRLQVQESMGTKYNGPVDCFKTTLANEGMRGFYKGVSAPIIGACLELAVTFAAYGYATKTMVFVNEKYRGKVGDLSVFDKAMAGFLVGPMTAALLCPIELIKCRLQSQTGAKGKYKGGIDCINQVVRSEGLRGIYRGYGVTLVRECPANFAWFGAYQLGLSMFKKGYGVENEDELGLLPLMVSGAAGGIGYWTLGIGFGVF